ncbi:MAG TPA: Type 1 glutamine amidotransferase-like domain-containing protein [Candidatus Acidoferrales bacterium]|nr:Type 1 glutamine amidotransferase-like domain-containing protein [Candidatus Acidoferrales bacterium]
MIYGPLALVGGDEFHPGNERQDEILRDACAGRPAYVVATAAQEYAAGAVESARAWFRGIGLEVRELRIRSKADADSPQVAEDAAGAGLVYIAGGDPGFVVETLRSSRVWKAIAGAWRAGAALAGSSAGAMALCQWCLVQTSWPGEIDERSVDALGLIPGTAILPHFDVLGDAWVTWAQEGLDDSAKVVGIDERTAAVLRDGRWEVIGPGGVTVLHGGLRNRHVEGESIEGMSNPEP